MKNHKLLICGLLAVALWGYHTKPAQAALIDWGFTEFIAGVLNSIKEALLWYLCYVLDLVWPWIELLLEAIPEDIWDAGGILIDWLGYFNFFIHIPAFALSVTAVTGYLLIFIAVKIVMKCIPTVG